MKSRTGQTYDPRARLLDLDETAERVGLSRETVLRRYTKRMPFVKIGRHLRITEADLAAWIEEQNGPGAHA